jgi:hypothetical protein
MASAGGQLRALNGLQSGSPRDFATYVKLSNVRAREMGISPATRWRAIEHLVRWGLIQKERVGKRKSPVLRIDWLAGRQPGGHRGNG